MTGSEPLSFVIWKWRGNNGRSFSSQDANIMAARVAQFYPLPHRFICITDDVHGLDPHIEKLPLPQHRFEHLQNPSERKTNRRGFVVQSAKRLPQCYRRLWNFSREAERVLGPRIFALDIDVIPVGDLRPLVERTADFVGWSDIKDGWSKIAGGAYLLRTGTQTRVWDTFDPETSPAAAQRAGRQGSDQGWMSLLLYPPAQRWTQADGLVKLKHLPRGATAPPPSARLVFTSGDAPPWDAQVQQTWPWVKRCWVR